MNDIKVNDEVFSKNDSEIYGVVSEVNGTNVVVQYDDGCEEDLECTVKNSMFSKSDDCWELPNWTLR